MTTGIGNEWDPGDPPEVHKERELVVGVDLAAPGEDKAVTAVTAVTVDGIPIPSENIIFSKGQFYTRAQVCEELGVNASTICRWEQKGLIPEAEKISGVCIYSADVFEKIKEVWAKSARNFSEEEACVVCKTRKARRGSTVCSRCSYSKLGASLRSTLPGMIKDEVPASPSSTLTDTSSEEVILNCPNCGSDDPADRRLVKTGPEEFPISLPCENEWHNQQARVTTSQLDLTKAYYTRRAIADSVGVSPTTICRWEAKGAIPPPLKSPHDNRLYYTEEHLAKAKEYATLVEQVKISPIAHTAKALGGNSLSRLTEKAVSLKIGRSTFRRGGLL